MELEKLVTLHSEQHDILEGLVEYGYFGIDNRTKVRYLNDAIKTSALDSVKTRIMSDESLQSDYNRCV